MPNVVVDARGITFRPSGARTRLVELLSAYVARPDAFDILVLASEGRRAHEFIEPLGIRLEERSTGPGTIVGTSIRIRTNPTADIVHRETTTPVPLLQRAPVAVTVHDLRSIEDRSLGHSRIKTLYERRALPVLSRAVDRFVAVSETTAERLHELLRVPRDHISVVPNGVKIPQASPPPAAPPLTDGRPFVLALGHLEPRKNLEVLLDVMDELTSDPGYAVRDLVLAGRDHGVASALLERHTAGPGAYRLHVCTDVDDDQRDALLRSTRCLVAPSRLEGFGLVPLEAMARGAPVVASDSAVTREVLGDGAVLVDTRRPGPIADALRGLEADTTLREAVVARGRRTAESYAWARSAEALHATYASMLPAMTPRHAPNRSGGPADGR